MSNPRTQLPSMWLVSYVKSQDSVAQYVTWTAHSPRRISTYLISLSLCIPSLGHRFQSDPHFSSLPILCVYLSCNLACAGVLLSVSSFQWEFFHMEMYLRCGCGERWVPHPLTRPFWSPHWMVVENICINMQTHIYLHSLFTNMEMKFMRPEQGQHVTVKNLIF